MCKVCSVNIKGPYTSIPLPTQHKSFKRREMHKRCMYAPGDDIIWITVHINVCDTIFRINIGEIFPIDLYLSTENVEKCSRKPDCRLIIFAKPIRLKA